MPARPLPCTVSSIYSASFEQAPQEAAEKWRAYARALSHGIRAEMHASNAGKHRGGGRERWVYIAKAREQHRQVVFWKTKRSIWAGVAEDLRLENHHSVACGACKHGCVEHHAQSEL